MELSTAIGYIIRSYRQEQGQTLTELANKVPMSIAHLSDSERGVKELSSSMLDSICYALKVPTHQIVIEAGYFMGGIPSTTRDLATLDYLLATR